MRHSNKERDNVAESRPGSNTDTSYSISVFASSLLLILSSSHHSRSCSMMLRTRLVMFGIKT